MFLPIYYFENICKKWQVLLTVICKQRYPFLKGWWSFLKKITSNYLKKVCLNLKDNCHSTFSCILYIIQNGRKEMCNFVLAQAQIGMHKKRYMYYRLRLIVVHLFFSNCIRINFYDPLHKMAADTVKAKYIFWAQLFMSKLYRPVTEIIKKKEVPASVAI